MGNIEPRSITGLNAKLQRRLAKAIKRSRAMGFMPVMNRHHHYEIRDVDVEMKKLKQD